MLHSAEMRWFVSGALPQEVLQWFRAGHDLQPEQERTDEYLVFPGCDTVGVKLRQGRLEIKALSSSPRPLALDPGINGRTDQWVKWSFESASLPPLVGELHQSGRWIRVGKTRYLRKWSADTGTLVEVPSEAFPPVGCNAELTCIELQAQPGLWYSLGFEAFGPPATNGKTLDETLRRFFNAHGGMPGIRLTGRESMSYPAWLATLS